MEGFDCVATIFFCDTAKSQCTSLQKMQNHYYFLAQMHHAGAKKPLANEILAMNGLHVCFFTKRLCQGKFFSNFT